METRIETKENGMIVKHILSDAEMDGKCRLYAEVTIPAGKALAYHEHTGESETYYILSGSGEYDDNGEKRKVSAGDVTFTPSGKGHGISNAGSEPLKFMALIILN